MPNERGMAKMPELELVVTNLTDTPKRVETRGFRPGHPTPVPLDVGMKMAGREGFSIEPANGVQAIPFVGKPPRLLWMSAFSVTDGYAVVAEATLHALLDAGADVAVHPCWFVERSDLLPETHRLIDKPIKELFQLGVCVAPPRFFASMPTRIRVGWTMWETTDFRIGRPEWQEDLARAKLNLLLVPTPWQVPVYAESGWVNCPVASVPFAIPQVYQPMDRPERNTFTVATWGTLNRRKGAAEAIQVFRDAFPIERYPDCRLWLKTKVGVLGHSIGGNPLPIDLSDPRVEVFDEMWTIQRMLGFLYEADCALFMSKGEGFGVPAREAMATALPAVLSANSGHEVVADPRFTWPVPTKRMINSDDQGGLWWEPDPDAAIEALRDVYHNRGVALKKAMAGAEWFHQTWGPAQVAEDILEIIGNLA
jgi:glycosyltransferase involved in cell wall biosynthesis